MANWKEVTERWLPIVEHMEEHSMDDYAIPEIYRAAEKAIDGLLESLVIIQETMSLPGNINTNWLKNHVPEAIRKHKGD